MRIFFLLLLVIQTCFSVEFLGANNDARNTQRKISSNHAELDRLTKAASVKITQDVDVNRTATEGERFVMMQSIIISAMVGGDKPFDAFTSPLLNPKLVSNPIYQAHIAAVLSIYEAARVVITYGGHMFGTMDDIAAEVDLSHYAGFEYLDAHQIKTLIGEKFIDCFYSVATYERSQDMKKYVHAYPDMKHDEWAFQVWAHKQGRINTVTVRNSSSKAGHKTVYVDDMPIAEMKPRGTVKGADGAKDRHRADNHELACTRIAKLLGLGDIIAPVYPYDDQHTVERFIRFEMPAEEKDKSEFQKAIEDLHKKIKRVDYKIYSSKHVAYLVPYQLGINLDSFISRPKEFTDESRGKMYNATHMTIEEISTYFNTVKTVFKPQQLAKLMVYWYVCLLVDFNRGNIMMDEQGNLFAIDAEYSLSAPQIDANLKKRWADACMPGFLGLPGMRDKAPKPELKKPSREALERIFMKYSISEFDAFIRRLNTAQGINWEGKTLNTIFAELFNGDYYRRNNEFRVAVDEAKSPYKRPESRGEPLMIGSLGPFDFPSIAATIKFPAKGNEPITILWGGVLYNIYENFGINRY